MGRHSLTMNQGMTTISVDYRERDLISAFVERGVDITVISLDVGDIHITHGGATVVLERKTWADYDASIDDGRYKEQKVRLMRLRESGSVCAFILERGSGMLADRVRHACISTAIRDGFPVIQSDGVSDTFEIVMYIAKMLRSWVEGDAVGFVKGEFKYSSLVKSKKKSNS